jgi:hypothetical protein
VYKAKIDEQDHIVKHKVQLIAKGYM